MPGRMESQIRHHLILTWGRKKYFEMRRGEPGGDKKYFEMRRGDRLITPKQQQDIIEVCRHHGWSGPIVYDGEQEDWLGTVPNAWHRRSGLRARQHIHVGPLSPTAHTCRARRPDLLHRQLKTLYSHSS